MPFDDVCHKNDTYLNIDGCRQVNVATGHILYDWNSPGEVCFVTAWDNTDEDVEILLGCSKGVYNQRQRTSDIL